MGPAYSRESPAPRSGTRRTGSEQDLVGRIRAARRRLAADGPPRVRSDGDFERVCLPVADADVLRDLLLAEKPGTVIEIGLAYGSSALAIAEALAAAGPDEARHVIIDAYQKQFHGCGWAAIAGAGLAGLCCLVEERSQIALPRLLGESLVAGAASVDGSHIFTVASGGSSGFQAGEGSGAARSAAVFCRSALASCSCEDGVPVPGVSR
jgi:hypothetical protein